MWSLFPPDERRLRAALEEQSRLGYSYTEQGMTALDVPPAGYVLDHNRVQVGRGEAAFRAACNVLRCWREFPAPWTRVWPADTPIEAGRPVTVAAHTLGLWWLN